MKKKIYIPLIIVLILCIIGIGAYASKDDNISLAEWGRYLSGKITQGQNSEAMINSDVNSDEVYMAGRTVNITHQDIEMAKTYYMIGGKDESEARRLAVDYVQERNSLYAAAVENGYSITNSELEEYINELKNIVSEADNKDEIYAIIDQFDTEDDYWDFEKEVYRIDLVIQKYVADLEKDYINSGGDDWDTEFELLKDNLAAGQNFTVVNE